MKRINPKEVVEAYKRTGVRPIRGKFCSRRDGVVVAACALSVLSSELFAIGDIRVTGVSSAIAALAEVLHLDRDYANDFVAGFDDDDDVCTEGYDDGLAAAAAVSGAGLVWA